MHIKITDPGPDEVLFESTFPTDFKTERSIEHMELELDHDLGKGRVKGTWFEGVQMIYGEVLFVNDSTLKAECDTPMLEMRFNLSGSNATKLQGEKNFVEFGHQQHNLVYMPPFEGVFHNQKRTDPNRFLEVNFTENFFRRLVNSDCITLNLMLEKMEKKQMAILGDRHMTMTPQMNRVIAEILGCQKKDMLKRLFIESKVMELLMLQVEQYEHMIQVPGKQELKTRDIEKIHEVKRIVEQNIYAPHSLADLSRQVGLNDFKLKKGFKETFGTTVFGYLLDLRMEQARNLLLNTDRSIMDISDEVGYKNPQHFTAAFKKKYGVTPKGLKQ